MAATLPPNRFKQGLAAGTPQIGFWLNFASPTVTEVCAGAGFDWLLIDMEHSPNELPGRGAASARHGRRHRGAGGARALERSRDREAAHGPGRPQLPLSLRAVGGGGAPRRGVDALSAPRASAASPAPRAPTATPACRTMPSVSRRTSAFSCRPRPARRWREIDQMAKVEGLDGIFIGPADLAADMGHIGNTQHPDVQAAIIEAGKRIKRCRQGAGLPQPARGRDAEGAWERASSSSPSAPTWRSSPVRSTRWRRSSAARKAAASV